MTTPDNLTILMIMFTKLMTISTILTTLMRALTTVMTILIILITLLSILMTIIIFLAILKISRKTILTIPTIQECTVRMDTIETKCKLLSSFLFICMF